MLASSGYPGHYEKGQVITGIDEANESEGVVVFHAGTIRGEDGLMTNGGRVLGVSAVGSSLQDALDTAYLAVDRIHYWGKQYRSDIGKKALSVIPE